MLDHSFELETDKAVDVVALRGALGWTQLQLAEHCGVDRSTVSTWETRPPTKGPALILLRQLQGSLSRQPQRSAAGDNNDFDAAAPAVVAAGPDCPSQAGAGLSFQQFQETADK
ncbi:helix-turn-helix domain-containing protein [Mesorhizobium sp. M0983]|uniref:helix-turn-helix domain-containing protein n=1 Tax=Mesorhizobium sp. M0983 TaxID=2957040 RepID=UPI00333AF0C0